MSNITAQNLNNFTSELENYIKEVVELEVEKKFKEKLENIEKVVSDFSANRDESDADQSANFNEVENFKSDLNSNEINSDPIDQDAQVNQIEKPNQVNSNFFQENDSSENIVSFENNDFNGENQFANNNAQGEQGDNFNVNQNNSLNQNSSAQEFSGLDNQDSNIPQPNTFEQNFDQSNNQVSDVSDLSNDLNQAQNLGDAYEKSIDSNQAQNLNSNESSQSVEKNIDLNQQVGVNSDNQAKTSFSQADDLLNNVVNKNWKN